MKYLFAIFIVLFIFFALYYSKSSENSLPNENNILTSSPSPQVNKETSEVQIYFGRMGEEECELVFPVVRTIIKKPAVARAALEELFEGPAQSEKEQGYFTSINPQVKIQKLTIVDGVARVDLNKTLEEGVGGSCRVLAIRSQIIQTLKQFSSVKEVIISIDGRTEDILQP